MSRTQTRVSSARHTVAAPADSSWGGGGGRGLYNLKGRLAYDEIIFSHIG